MPAPSRNTTWVSLPPPVQTPPNTPPQYHYRTTVDVVYSPRAGYRVSHFFTTAPPPGATFSSGPPRSPVLPSNSRMDMFVPLDASGTAAAAAHIPQTAACVPAYGGGYCPVPACIPVLGYDAFPLCGPTYAYAAPPSTSLAASLAHLTSYADPTALALAPAPATPTRPAAAPTTSAHITPRSPHAAAFPTSPRAAAFPTSPRAAAFPSSPTTAASPAPSSLSLGSARLETFHTPTPHAWSASPTPSSEDFRSALGSPWAGSAASTPRAHAW